MVPTTKTVGVLEVSAMDAAREEDEASIVNRAVRETDDFEEARCTLEQVVLFLRGEQPQRAFVGKGVSSSEPVSRGLACKLAFYQGVRDKQAWWAMVSADTGGAVADESISAAKLIAWMVALAPGGVRVSIEAARQIRTEVTEKAAQFHVKKQPDAGTYVLEGVCLPDIPLSLRIYRDPLIGITGHTWPGALAMLRFLAERPDLVRGKRILELGASTGVLGIGCDCLLRATGSEQHAITITDQASAVALMSSNIELNTAGRTTARALDWGEPDLRAFAPPLDVVLMAEVAYLPETYPALAATVVALCGPQTLVLHGYKHRESCKTEIFFGELTKLGVRHLEVTSANVAAEFAGVQIWQHALENSVCALGAET
jgi:predicted nicotinamide N-methyase